MFARHGLSKLSCYSCRAFGTAMQCKHSRTGHGFLVADAGGGTLDISSYAIRGTSPLVMEEIAPPDCAPSAPPGARRHSQDAYLST